MPVPIEDVAVDKDFFLYEKGCSYISKRVLSILRRETHTLILYYEPVTWEFSSNRDD